MPIIDVQVHPFDRNHRQVRSDVQQIFDQAQVLLFGFHWGAESGHTFRPWFAP